MILTALIFILILSVLVLIHEAGHFFAAKKFGIKVEEFGYGIPPRAWGKKIGETLYSINWLPFGGFVKLYGEDEAGSGSVKVPAKKLPTKDLDRAFFTRPAWQRAIVVVAGVVMNTLLAFVIFYTYISLSNYKVELPILGDNPPRFTGANQINIPSGVIVGRVAENSPAEVAGINAPAVIISVNNRSVKNIDDFTQMINKNKGKDIFIKWFEVDSGKIYEENMTPRVNAPKNQGAIGVSLGYSPYNAVILHYETSGQKMLSGISHSLNMVTYTINGFGSLINRSVQERSIAPVGEGVSGPIGIFKVIGQILEIPDIKYLTLQMLNLAGILSISLAFFNVLPIPALDGGRLFFILIELVTKKKVSPTFEAAAHSIGMAVLLGLIILVTFKDIVTLFK